MSNYNIAKIYPNDRFANTQIEKLLQEEGIRRDPNLDYTCGMYDEDMNPIDVARHPRQIIKIPIEKKLEKWDLIRIKK